LQTTNGAAVATTVTSASGAYLFTNVPPGAYRIVETDLPGWLSTADTSGTNDNQIAVTLGSGQAATDNNFLDTQPGSITGSVLEDFNGNGVADAGDTIGVSGATVALQTTNGTPVATTVTSAGGEYQFTAVPPGDYVVVETDLSGWLSTADTGGTNDNHVAVTLTSGQASTGNNFLDVAAATITGQVLVDVNGNGVIDVEDGSGINGVTLQLLNAASNVVASTTTAGAGAYSFTNLAPGSYTVAETDPSGYLSTGDSSGANDNRVAVTLSSGQTSGGNSFLDAQPVTIGDYVWVDRNGNGIQDGGEPGLTNVTIRLLDIGNNAEYVQSSDTNGMYAFTNLAPATYMLHFVAPSGMVFTVANQGGNTLTDSDVAPGSGDTAAFALTAGQTDTTRDAGLYQPSGLGGFTFVDQNATLIRDDDDPAVTNMLVMVWTNGAQMISMRTDTNGYYAFTNLAPGAYEIRFHCYTNALVAVPGSEPASTNVARSRAIGTTNDNAYILYTLTSGEEAGTGGQPLNAGFRPNVPTASAILIQAYATADGVVVEFASIGEVRQGFIGLDVYDADNQWLWSGATNAAGRGNNRYRFLVPGLVPGQAYNISVCDEEGKYWDAQQVPVGTFAAKMLSMSLLGMTLTFDSLNGRQYDIQWAPTLGAAWQTVVTNLPSQGATTSILVKYPDFSSPSGFFRIVLQ
ncbi:MAG: SdrD B-like domain-containing protein, partial [bacterium]